MIESSTKNPQIFRWLRLAGASAGLALLLALLTFSAVLWLGISRNQEPSRQIQLMRRRQHELFSSAHIARQKEVKTEKLRNALFSSIQPRRIDSTLRLVTKEPHVAGTPENRRVAEALVKLWRDNGLEEVKLHEYEVLLSYPNWEQPNQASLLGNNGQVLFRTLGLSPDLLSPEGGGNNRKAATQWVAYSGNGTVVGEPVFCNYGRKEDFDRLEQEFGLSRLDGKIAVIRYGRDYRGDKVKRAQDRGAIGAIIYSDPQQVADPDRPDAVFPKTDHMPPEAVQRGSLMEWNGDPGTPLLPARKDFFRELTVEQNIRDRWIPSIPVLPMSYGDATQFLSRLAGPAVPSDWQGGLKFTYHIGPGFRDGQGSKMQLDVHSSLEIKTIQNVIGMIRGWEEPDQWVMLGNHYDAWAYGALDPNSGTAIMAEVGRSFAQAVKQRGWRPRRSIVFCNWDSEEFGIIGSSEFVEEFADLLKDRAVVYINVDLICGNETLMVDTVPSLYKTVTDAAKKVKNPRREERARGRLTAYDSWRVFFPPEHSWLPEVPKMRVPGANSDHHAFLHFLGIPVVDMRYMNTSTGTYHLYHTRYEIPYVSEKLFDHEHLAIHKAVGEYWAELARSFADEPVLPISPSIFAQKLIRHWLADLREAINELHAKFPAETEPAMRQMEALSNQAQIFADEASRFEAQLNEVDARWANRRLQKVDQCFTNPSMGMAAQKPIERHVLFAISEDDSYLASVMVVVNGKIRDLSQEADAEHRTELGRQLALEMTVVQYSVLCATNTLKPFI